jgi:hypothetical protein
VFFVFFNFITKEQPVYVEKMPAAKDAYLNDRIKFLCKYYGMPIPTIVWRKTNLTLIPNNKTNIQTFP